MTARNQELEDRIKYQRAIYRYHDCDDPALKEHFAGIIKAYEKKHNIIFYDYNNRVFTHIKSLFI